MLKERVRLPRLRKGFSMRNRLLLKVAGMAVAGWIASAGTASAAAVYVRIAPPRPVVERVAVAPRPGYVWAGGYYRWSGRAYVWVPGQWLRPPRARAVWVAPRWDYVPARHSYVFVAGFWR
jgi:hypothetical protein